MTPTLAADSRRVVDELSHLLVADPAALDPRAIHLRLATIERRVCALTDRTWPDGGVDVQSGLVALRAVLDDAPAPDLPVDEAARAWSAFRERCAPAAEALATALHAEAPIPSEAAALAEASVSAPAAPAPEAPRPTNYTRNAYHVANALVVVLLVELVLTTWAARVGVAVAGFCAAWTMELTRRVSPRINALLMGLFAKVAHPHESTHVNSATWYTTAILILAVGFPIEAGLAGLVVLGLG
ncbi:MAG: hypothetical protein ABMB14_36720, partial [Myxococcota bacterium]